MRRSRLGTFAVLIGFALLPSTPQLLASSNFNIPPESWTQTGELTNGPDGNLWFTEFTSGRIGRITPGGTLTEFSVPGAAILRDIVTGPDGNLWFTDVFAFSSPYIGRITPTGTVTKFPVGHPGTYITKGPDGALWFAAQDGFLGRITTSGAYSEFPTGSANPFGITTGPDGNLWFTSADLSVIGKMTTSGLVTLYPIPSGGLAFSIVGNPADGNVWFTEGNFCGAQFNNIPCVNLVAKITPTGAATEYQTTNTPHDITVGPDNRLWFKEQSGPGSTALIGAIATNGTLSEYQSKQLSFPRVAGPRGITSGPGGQLWLLGNSNNSLVASVNTAGTITAVNVFQLGVGPLFITSAPDGNLWFTDNFTTGVGKITPTGAITTFPSASACAPQHITTGPDGNLWIADGCGFVLQANINTGAITQFPVSNGGVCGPFGIASASGNLWVTDQCAPVIYEFTTAGAETDFPIPSGPGAGANAIVTGPDGNLWYTNSGTNSIGQITPAGGITEFPLPAGASAPFAITVGPDNNLWFADDDFLGTVGKITTAGVITIYTPAGAMSGFSFGQCAQDIISGPDGNLWVGAAQFCIGAAQDIYAISTSGIVQMITGPNLPANPSAGLAKGPDNKLWLAGLESGAISRMSAISGTISVTPTSNPGPTTVSASANFVDGTPAALAADFTATINWGDGTTAPLTVAGSTGGPFSVNAGNHPYAKSGNFLVTITLHDTVDNQDYPLNATVNLGQPSQTFIYSSTNPAAIGSILTLTARVAAAPGGSGTPTGTVTFQDQGFINLGTANLDANGYASFSSSSITAAASTHSITAVYNGDATFLGSTSPALNESIKISQGFLFKDNGNSYGVGSNPVDAAIGDFNRDGIPDFALADSSNNAVGIFIGNGDGTFTSGPVYTLADPPSALAVGDFNRDRKLDLLVGFAPGTSCSLGVFLGNGDGTFGTMSQCIAAGVSLGSIAVADFNHDGILDVVATEFANHSLDIAMGAGNGTFGALGVFNPPLGFDAQQLLVADFNNDGTPDVVVANPAGGIQVVLFNSAGGLQATQPSPASSGGSSPYRMALGDFNRDGKLDVIVTDNASTSATVLLGKGDGTFAAPVSYALDDISCYPGVLDVNHDGILDVGFPCPSSHGGFLLGNGDGTFQPFLTIQGGGPKGTPEAIVKLLAADFNRDGTTDALTVNGPPDSSAGASLFVSPGPLEPSWGVSSYTFGTNPWDVTVGSFRNNGELDLAVTDKTANQVFVLSNNGSGTFSAPTANAVGNAPKGILTGDLNGDGKLDLLTIAQNSNQVDALLGTGTGTFQAAVAYNTTANASPDFGVLSDFNGDGTLDLAVSDNALSAIDVFLGNGNGTFQAPVKATLTGASVGITAGDFNGDGTIDLAAAVNGDNSINVLLGNGSLSWGETRYALAAGSAPVFITTGDFNRDGKVDIAFTAAGTNNYLGIMLGNGDGTFQPAVTYAIAGGVSVGGLTVLDANRDGKPDIALVDTGNNNVLLFEGNGDGSFHLAGTYPLGANAAPMSISSGDFNGDGAPDLVTSDSSLPGASVLMSNQKTSTVTSYSTCTTPAAVALGDFNGDGAADMAVVNAGCNSVTIRLGNGDGTFQSATTSYTVQNNPSAIAIGDFNGDGKLDVAVTNKSSNSVSILIGNGDGTFVVKNNYAVGVAPSSISVSDVNKDGKLDLVVANSGDGTLSVLKGNGDGTFQSAVTVASMNRGRIALSPSLINPLAVAMGDVNADGKPDMIVADGGSNDVAVLLNTGVGFGSATTYATGTQPSAVALGSLRGNGKVDIVVADAGSNDVAILLNNGNGTFGAATEIGVGRAPDAIAVLDYNSDGHLDIVVANSGDNTVMVLLGNGDGSFQSPITIAAGTGPNGLAVGNLTGGGNGDLVVTNGNSGSVSVLLNAAAVLMGGSSSGTSVYGHPATLTTNVLPAVKTTRIPTGTVTFQSGSTVLGHAALDNQGTGTLTTSVIPGGTNTITFTYSGSTFFNQQTATIFQIVTPATPNIMVVPSASPAGFGQPLTLTAIVGSQTGVGVPSGSVSFTDTFKGVTTPLGSGTLNGTGASSIIVSSLAVGTHSIVASYHGDTNFTAIVSLALSETINKQPTSLTLNSTAIQSFFNQSVTFAAHLSASGAPTGNINFMDSNTLLASVAPNGSGDAQYTTSTLAVGNHNISAQYAGDANFGASVASLTQTVNKAPITLEIVSSQNPSTVAAPAQFLVTVKGLYGGTPSGSIAFADGSTALAGSPVLLSANAATLQPPLAAGVHTINASYGGDGNFLGSTDGVVQVVNSGGAATTLVLSASTNPVYFNRASQQVTLTASLSSGTAGTPTGTIIFMDDDQVLAAAQPLGTSGCPGGAVACATFTTDQLTIGAHHIIAIYGGDGTFAGTTSSTPSQPFYELDRSPRFKR